MQLIYEKLKSTYIRSLDGNYPLEEKEDKKIGSEINWMQNALEGEHICVQSWCFFKKKSKQWAQMFLKTDLEFLIFLRINPENLSEMCTP